MLLAPMLIRELQLHHRVIHRQVVGLTHEDSLLQPAMRGNCLNWVLGHIVESRMEMLTELGETPLWPEAERARYTGGSAPVISGDDALRFEKILADFDAAQELLIAAINRTTEEAFDVKGGENQRTLGERLNFLSWHETYHVGQTEYLRQLTGVNDKVI